MWVDLCLQCRKLRVALFHGAALVLLQQMFDVGQHLVKSLSNSHDFRHRLFRNLHACGKITHFHKADGPLKLSNRLYGRFRNLEADDHDHADRQDGDKQQCESLRDGNIMVCIFRKFHAERHPAFFIQDGRVTAVVPFFHLPERSPHEGLVHRANNGIRVQQVYRHAHVRLQRPANILLVQAEGDASQVSPFFPIIIHATYDLE